MISVRLPVEIEERLHKLCTLTKRSKSFYIREALELYLEEVEDLRIAMERLSRPNQKYLTTAEVLKRLNTKS